ncbi:hypothetical protein PMAYCL1PPCAC_01923, partial [Pristionchus mayeri]
RNTIFTSSFYSRVVLNGEVLSADHSVSLEPLAAELLGGSIGGVGPLDGHTVVVGVLKRHVGMGEGGGVPYLLSVGEGIARDSDEGVLLGVEDSGSGINSESLHVGRLEGPSNATSRGGALKTILVPGWVAMSPGGTD